MTDSRIVNKLVIVGLGLIGGSLAAALRKAQACQEIIAVVRSRRTAEIALQNHLADRVFFSLTDVANELGAGDVIVIAVPTLSISDILLSIKKHVDRLVTITDVASVKGSVVESATRIFGETPTQFVPGHPIAGSEKSGVTAANGELYLHHRVILTPAANTSSSHLQRISKMWQAVGADVLTMSIAKHDAVLAATSHLPHAIAYSLVNTLVNDSDNENIFRYAAGGFRDFTRIASSDPLMWHDIMRANQAQIIKAIDLFQDNLAQLREAIATDDGDYLLKTFAEAKKARDHFTALPPVNVNKSMDG